MEHFVSLGYCDKGNEVARLQVLLREVRFALEPDGFFGHMTREAVKTFQAVHGLPCTGRADPVTWSVLEETVTALLAVPA